MPSCLKRLITVYKYSIFCSLCLFDFVIIFTLMTDALAERVAVLEAKLEEVCVERDLYKAKFERAEEENARLREIIKQFQRHRFGSRSERYIDPDMPIQGDLFAEVFSEEELEPANEKEANDNVISIAAHKRRKKNSKLPTNLPHREEIIEVKDKVCGCGATKTVIRYIISKRIHQIPERFEIVVEKREVVVCPRGCKGSMEAAPNPPRILPKAQVTEEFLANIIVSKLHDRQPLYHLEQKFKNRFGFEISRNKLARWFIDTSKALQPLLIL